MSSFEALSIKPLNHEKGSANTNTLGSDAGRRKAVSASGLEGQFCGLGVHASLRKAKALNAQAEPASSGQGRAVNSSFLVLYPLLYFLVAFGSC